MPDKKIAIIGAGPAGLAAAEELMLSGHAVHVFDAMPSPARKFLWAGKTGLNLTHIEDFDRFKTRFGAASAFLAPALDRFTPTDIQNWAAGLGVETFAGTSGRVFPQKMKASPLLRAWLKRLDAHNVKLHKNHYWRGFDGDELLFNTPQGEMCFKADATIFALGGASYKRLGSDAAWVDILRKTGVEITPFRPANCGFNVKWSDYFRDKFHGAPVKSVELYSALGNSRGEFVITRYGVEGSLIYAHASALRDGLAADENHPLLLDLLPARSVEQIIQALARQNPRHSFSNRLRKGLKLAGVKAGLLREVLVAPAQMPIEILAQHIKALPIPLESARPIEEAISVAGGIALAALDENYMLLKRPGVFVAGEMLDWEAPTGGYLLSACFATGRAAARGVLSWV